jgi:hypothetical protein
MNQLATAGGAKVQALIQAALTNGPAILSAPTTGP